MPVVCKKFGLIDNDFERGIFDTLCREFQTAPGDYTVIGPFWIDGTEIDGLLITPKSILTIEAKDVGVRVEKLSANLPLNFYDRFGQEIDLSDRHKDAFSQAAAQWKKVKDLIVDNLGGGDLAIFVQSMLVVPSTSELDVMAELRNPANFKAPIFIFRLNEITEFAQQFSPGRVLLSRDIQDTFLTIIQDGNGNNLTPQQKSRAVIALTAPQSQRQSSPETGARPDPPKEPGYQPPRRPGSEPPNETPAQGRTRGWIWLLLSALFAFGAYRLVSNSLKPLPSALFSGFILLVLLSRKWWAIGYALIAGAAYTAMAFLTSLTGLLPLAASLLWPITLCGLLTISFIDGDLLPLNFDFSSPAIVATEPVQFNNPPPTMDDLPDSTPTYADEETGPTATPAAEPTTASATEPADAPPTQETKLGRVRIKEASNVRAGPGIDFDKVGIVPDGAEYPIVEISSDLNWYLIELENGTRVWIGSSRIEQLLP
jgi:hypothetical protein